MLTYQAELLARQVQRQIEQQTSHGIAPPAQQLAVEVRTKMWECVSKLEPFAYLYDGWDGQGSRAPTVASLWQAVADTCQLVAVGLPVPDPKALSDGTLGVYWKKGKRYATIDFESDGVHLWTVTNGKTFKSGTWDATKEIPTELRSIALSRGQDSEFATL